jgi:hypothetical protein
LNRLSVRTPQITSDGLALYRPAIEQAFGSEADFAQLVKQYETPHDKQAQRRYSPAVCTGATKTVKATRTRSTRPTLSGAISRCA